MIIVLFASLVIYIIVICICFLVGIACLIAAAVIMAVKRRKEKDTNTKVKKPWYVILLRVIGIIALIPPAYTLFCLIDAGIDNHKDKKNNLPSAVMSYDYERAEELLKKGADPDVRDLNGYTLLMSLAEHSYFEDKKHHTWDYPLFNFKDEEKQDIKMMKLLIKYGADVNAQVTDCEDTYLHEYDEDSKRRNYGSDHICGNTPLIFSIKNRNPEVSSFLIENGADINLENSCGFTPLLMCAATCNNDSQSSAETEMLIKAGADLNAVTNFHDDINSLLENQGSSYAKEFSEFIENATSQKAS